MKNYDNRPRSLLKKYDDPHYGVKKILESILEHPKLQKDLKDILLAGKDRAWQIFVQQEGDVKP